MAAGGLARRVTHRFNSLSAVQVVVVWLGWGLIWWLLFYIGAATGGGAVNVWIALCLIVAFVGGPLLMALTFAWFGARRLL
jgi:hypothetical protein